MPDQTEKFEGWAIVEVMGHKKFAGRVSEQTIAGSALVRVDVPETEPGPHESNPYTGASHAPAYEPKPTAGYTKLIGVGSIYMITPCTEDLARRAARQLERHNDPIPVALPSPRRLTAGASVADDADVIEADDLPY